MLHTTTGHDGVLPKLDEHFSGDLIRPSDPRFGAARTVWNAIVDRRPALIACPRTPADVASAILSARDRIWISRSAAGATASRAIRCPKAG